MHLIGVLPVMCQLCWKCAHMKTQGPCLSKTQSQMFFRNVGSPNYLNNSLNIHTNLLNSQSRKLSKHSDAPDQFHSSRIIKCQSILQKMTRWQPPGTETMTTMKAHIRINWFDSLQQENCSIKKVFPMQPSGTPSTAAESRVYLLTWTSVLAVQS